MQQSAFGRYIPGNSFIYKIDPRVKVLLSILMIVLIFIASSFIELFLLAFLITSIFIFSTKRIIPVIKTLKLPLIISVVLFLVNLYTVNNETVYKNDYYVSYFWPIFTSSSKDLEINGKKVLWTEFYNAKVVGQEMLDYYIKAYGPNVKIQYGVSINSINRIIALVIRLYVMVLTTSLLTNTTRPILLNKSIESLLFPLKFLFIPTHIIAMIISIALRFIPTLVNESFRIIKAQSSRGVDFKHGNTKEKIIAFTTLIIPLFVSSFQKAEDLANSMETRGYDPYEKRTKYRVFKLKVSDLLILTLFFGILTIFILNNLVIKYSNFNPTEGVYNLHKIGHYSLFKFFLITKVVS